MSRAQRQAPLLVTRAPIPWEEGVLQSGRSPACREVDRRGRVKQRKGDQAFPPSRGSPWPTVADLLQSLKLAWLPSVCGTKASVLQNHLVNSSVEKAARPGPSQGAVFPQTPVGWFPHRGDPSVDILQECRLVCVHFVTMSWPGSAAVTHQPPVPSSWTREGPLSRTQSPATSSRPSLPYGWPT